MRAAIYSRASRDVQGQGRSVESQEAECRAVCAREGWDVAEVFCDNGRSGSRYARRSREAFERLAGLVERREIDVVVCWEASRLQRDLAAYVALRDVCAAAGIFWSYSGRTYDLSRADDRFQTGLDALLSEREADVIRDRNLRGVRANAMKGRPHGRPLFGYRREYHPATGALVRQVIDEDRAEVVREAARRVLGGETCHAVAEYLNQRGVPTPRAAAELSRRAAEGTGRGEAPDPARGKGWDLTQVKRLLINPSYAGKRVHQGKIIGDAAWPAILDEADWGQLVAKLTDPARRTNRDSAVRHLLSGIARCGISVCGAPVRVFPQRGGYLSYFCADGWHVARRLDWVDDFVEAVMVERLSRPDVLELLVAEDEQNAVHSARIEAAEKRSRLDGFYDAAAAGKITPAALARIEARLLPEIGRAERRAQPVPVNSAVATAAGPNAAEIWAELPLTTRREVIDVLATVRILPGVRGSKTFDPSRIEISWRRA